MLTQTKKKKGGFTLIEVIAVLILLGILAAIALPRYIDLTTQARARAIDAAVSELNGREALAWGQVMLDQSGAATDALVWGVVAPGGVIDLGGEYTWGTGPNQSGASNLAFQTAAAVAVTRTPAADPTQAPAVWAGP